MAFGEKYDLVTEDYYQKEIEFQGVIDKVSNAKQLNDKLKISIDNDQVVLSFPESELPITGHIEFFRPSDESQDFKENIELSSGVQKIALNKFVKGKYIVKTDWKMGETGYYQENTIFIP